VIQNNRGGESPVETSQNPTNLIEYAVNTFQPNKNKPIIWNWYWSAKKRPPTALHKSAQSRPSKHNSLPAKTS
jgi:hypothetical protein